LYDTDGTDSLITLLPNKELDREGNSLNVQPQLST
jgi:hypothetical protein